VRECDPRISLRLLDGIIHVVGNDLDDVQPAHLVIRVVGKKLDYRSNARGTCQQRIRLAVVDAVCQLSRLFGPHLTIAPPRHSVNRGQIQA